MTKKIGLRLNPIGSAQILPIRFPDSFLQRIKTEADRRGVSRAVVIRQAAEIGLEKLKTQGVRNATTD